MESKFLSCPNCEAVYIADTDYSKPEAKPAEPQRYISYCSNCDNFLKVD